MAKYHVGVDVGKDRHHVCIRDLSRDTYYKTFSITNDHTGFMELVHSVDTHGQSPWHFIIQASLDALRVKGKNIATC